MNNSDAQTVLTGARAFVYKVLVKAAPAMPITALLKAIEWHCEEGRIDARDVADCVTRAGDISRLGDLGHTKGPAQVTTSRTVCLPSSQGGQITSQHRVIAHEPWVTQLREELFGKQTRPFPSLKRAELWLRHERGTARPALNGDGRLKSLAFKALRVDDDTVWIGADGVTFPASHMSSPDDAAERKATRGGASTPVAVGSTAERLADATAVMVPITGFSQSQLVAWVLWGAKPTLPRPRLTVIYGPRSTGEPVGRRTSTIYRRKLLLEFEESEFTMAALRSLYTRARKLLGSAKGKQFTEDDRRLHEIVVRLGGPQGRSHSGQFWVDVAREWKAKTGKSVNPDALRMKHARNLRALGGA